VYVQRYVRRTCVLVVAMEKQGFPLALLVSFKTDNFAVNRTKYSVLCVHILALVIRHADCTFLCAPCYVVTCGLSDSTVFFRIDS